MYYDYDFSQMVDELQDLNDTNSNIYTEIKAIHKEQTDFFTQTNQTLTVISIFIVVSIAVKVFFR